MKKSIGILGGMGPLATADLFRKIVLLTKASCDNDHIRIYIDNNPAIADRTAAILSGGESPLPEMIKALRNLEACGASCIVMPCNTAHYFLPELQKLTRVPFISMLAATARTCAAQYPGKCAAVLATKGTLQTGLYSQALAREGLRCLLPEVPGDDGTMTCAHAGVLGAAVGVLGSIQAVEAVKYLLGIGQLLTGRVLYFDGLNMEFREMEAEAEVGCPICGSRKTIYSVKENRADYEEKSV